MSYASRKVIFPGDVKNHTLPIYSSADAGAVTKSSSESEIYMVISWRLYAGVKAYWLNRLRFQQR
jgi:hypothetical protein